MNLISKLGQFLLSRRVLIAVLAALLCAAIFLAGPLLSFGGWHPLESVAVRLALIALVLVLIALRPRQLPTWLFGVVLLALLAWFAGPSLTIGAQHPLESVQVRLIVIAVLAALATLYGAYLLWRSSNAEGTWLWHQTRRMRAVSAPALPDELRLVTGIVEHALRQLKRLRARSSILLRLFDSKRYLYQLPWYLVLGAPASGKTSVILNSGLNFPTRGTTRGKDPEQDAPHKATEHCDWWLADRAVFIDTAGGYTMQAKGNGSAASEWRALLGLLKRHRPRAPLNGVLLSIDATQLLAPDAAERALVATALRARLVELKRQLGVRLPVYVILSKLDLLCGFNAYFESLIEQERAQVWGFTLAYDAKNAAKSDGDEIRSRCSEELAALARRLEHGVARRLQEESDLSRRKALYTLPHEFAHLVGPLLDLLEAIFVDSKYDAMPLAQNLRGVYLSSAAQPLAQAEADAPTLVQRLLRQANSAEASALRAGIESSDPADKVSPPVSSPASPPAPAPGIPAPHQGGGAPGQTDGKSARNVPRTSHSFFLHDLFASLILNEAHLVRPNRRWELRHRVAHGLAHGLTLAAFGWLALEVSTSFDNNRNYLAAVDAKAHELKRIALSLDTDPSPTEAAGVLSAVRMLPTYRGLNLDDPAPAFRFGLYSAPPIVAAAAQTYARLQDDWLLPQVVKRVEDMLARAVADNDAQATYDTLRVYLMLHEPNRYQAKDVRALVMAELQRDGDARLANGTAATLPHLDEMLENGRVLRAAGPLNRHLVTQARQLLGSTTTAQRLYERAKASLASMAPADFTVTRAVGPQAWTVFRRASGKSLDQGIPGLFTVDGYREVFQRQLPGMLEAVRHEEAWVMGRIAESSPVPASGAALDAGLGDPLLDDIRGLYLSEYAARWQRFLADIHVAQIDNRALMLQTLRTFSMPNSPLQALARAVSQQTTLTQPIEKGAAGDAQQPSLVGKTMERLGSPALGQARQVQSIWLRGVSSRQERELVDDRFMALREMVHGASGASGSAGASNTPLDALAQVINDYYALLLMAETAPAGQNLPPQADTRAKLRFAASTAPAPLHNILTDLVQAGTKTVNRATSNMLHTQQRGVIGSSCSSTIAGKYPFAASRREVAADDFVRIFASGGTLDDFFQKNLAAYVDTSTRPWRYRPVGPDAPAPQGPSLMPYERAQKIREVFFRDRDARKISWKMDVQVVEMDPSITELILDLDGQKLRYVHGPIQPLRAVWPGPRGGMTALLSVKPARRAAPAQGASAPASGLVNDLGVAALSTSGPWALLKLLARGRPVQGTAAGYLMEYDFDGRKAVLEISSDSMPNPQTMNMLRAFRCPASVQ